MSEKEKEAERAYQRAKYWALGKKKVKPRKGPRKPAAWWPEANRLFSENDNITEIAKTLGVDRTSVKYAVDPEYRNKKRGKDHNYVPTKQGRKRGDWWAEAARLRSEEGWNDSKIARSIGIDKSAVSYALETMDHERRKNGNALGHSRSDERAADPVRCHQRDPHEGSVHGDEGNGILSTSSPS